MVFHPRSWTDPEGLRAGQFAFCEDSEGNMWIAHFGVGISMLEKKEKDRIFTLEKLHPRWYYSLTGSPKAPSSIRVLDIHRDLSNRMWFGTLNGLNLYSPDEELFYTFDESDGLPNADVRGILEDDQGNLWVCTLDGICMIELKEGYGPDIIKSTHTYGIAEGIGLPIFSSNANFKSPDGWMYFSGSEGITMFHPDSIRKDSVAPPVHLSNILINGISVLDLEKPILDHSIIETEKIKLPYKQNFLGFEYVALNFLVAEKSQYKYMMEGLDRNWVEAGTRRFAEYRDLKPGEYTFRVIASNEDGLWNEEGDSIGIIVNPPWYRTILAYVIYAFLIAGAIYGFIQWRTWRIRKERDQLETQVKERTAVIESQKEEILSAKTVLEGQKEELEQQKEELQITLENLQKTQLQLIQSEKLASLGGLVAGVAHEINTPVGISVTAASNLAEETQEMADKYKANKISRAEFKDYLNTANQSAKLILSNMERAASMVQSFKQVSVDQSTEQKRKFKLKEYSEDVIRSLYPRLKGKKIKINLDMDYQLELNSYPGAFSQILTNLILNSLVHGFEGKSQGNIEITAQQKNGELEINYRDDGKGIPESNLNKIFDPFFSTDKKAGTGPGLHIVYNLVNQKLQGTITCSSKKKKGVDFKIIIPF
jgi:signal transduction histidine kinase